MTKAEGITRREREVWSLVAEHLTNREIAGRLFLSVRTVETHVASLIHKLQLADRRALAHHAAASGGTRPVRKRWPAMASSFIGREREQAALRAAIGAHRMVTAVGPGGVGKTRLALCVVEQIARNRRDGGWFVDLVDVTEHGTVMHAIAGAVGVVAPLDGSLAKAVGQALADSDAVLLLDNCEHVLDGVRDCVSALLPVCAGLTIVATSRIALRLPSERVYAVPALSLAIAGGAGQSREAGDAVTLFIERALAAGAGPTLDLDRVAQVCARLDGMALAIELAAARCPALGLDGLAEGLAHSLRLLQADREGRGRHRSMSNAIAWSYRLLPARDRAVLHTASAFASWFDVHAAHALAGAGQPSAMDRVDVADALARLADNQLLVVAAGRPTRYRALETIQQFAAERLVQLGHDAVVHERHLRWCRAQLAALADQPRDDAWCDRLDGVAIEARAALAWAEAHPCGPEAAQLAELLAAQQLLRGRPGEAQRCFEQAARLSDDDAQQARRLRLAAGAAASRLVGNDVLRLLDEAATHALAAGDPDAAAQDLAWMAIFVCWAPGIIAVLPDAQQAAKWLARAQSHAGPSKQAQAAIAVAAVMQSPHHDPQVAERTEQAAALARQASTPLLEGVALDHLCTLHLASERIAAAVESTHRRGDFMERAGLDASTAYHLNDYLLMASEVHLAAGQLREAGIFADRLAQLACYRDYPHPALARRIKVDAMAGDFEAAVDRGRRFAAAWDRAGRPVSRTLNVTAYAMAMVHGMLGDEDGRSEWIAITHALMQDPGSLAGCATGWAPTFDALLALDQGRPEQACARLGVDIDDRSVWGDPMAGKWRPWYAAAWAEAAVLAGRPDAGERLRRAASATRENAIAAAIVDRAAAVGMRGNGLLPQAQAFARLGCMYQQKRTETLLAGKGTRPGRGRGRQGAG